MANFNTTGIDGLQLSMEEVIALPEDVLLDMLTAEGEVVARAQRKKIVELDLVDSHQLEKSITVDKKLRSNGRYSGSATRYINVYPKGKRTKADGETQQTAHKYKKRRRGKTESIHDTTNSEVGFVNEFGASERGIKPTQWMLAANEEAADEAVADAMKIYDEWLKSKNL